MAVFTAAADISRACANDNETFAAFLLDVRGQAAALAGVALTENPYTASSFEAACWSAGWLAGERALAAFPVAQPGRVRLRAVPAEPLAG